MKHAEMQNNGKDRGIDIRKSFAVVLELEAEQL